MRKISYLLITSALLCSCKDKPVTELPTEGIPLEHLCFYTETPVVIDGVLDDKAWENSLAITDFRTPKLNEKPESKTIGRLAWDDEYLYVAFEAEDQDLLAIYQNHDDLVFKDDVLEIFCQPVAGSLPYFNIETNINGAYLDQNSEGGIPWNFKELKSATTFEGTLNDPSDRDQKWFLEIAIPFVEAPGAGRKAPSPGDQWKFHLARYDYSKYISTSPELTSIAPLSRVNFHKPEDWVTLTFIKE